MYGNIKNVDALEGEALIIVLLTSMEVLIVIYCIVKARLRSEDLELNGIEIKNEINNMGVGSVFPDVPHRPEGHIPKLLLLISHFYSYCEGLRVLAHRLRTHPRKSIN